MLSFKDYFQLNESIQSVELMSTILNQEPIILNNKTFRISFLL
jgi:hypothetical protein